MTYRVSLHLNASQYNINEPKKSFAVFFGSFACRYYFLNSLLPMKNRARVPGPT